MRTIEAFLEHLNEMIKERQVKERAESIALLAANPDHAVDIGNAALKIASDLNQKKELDTLLAGAVLVEGLAGFIGEIVEARKERDHGNV